MRLRLTPWQRLSRRRRSSSSPRCEPLQQQRHGHPPAEPRLNPLMTSKTSLTLRTTSLSPPPPSPPLSSKAPQLLEAGHQVRHLTLMALESRSHSPPPPRTALVPVVDPALTILGLMSTLDQRRKF